MIEEKLTFDCNSKTEAIVTQISEHLKQGFKISLLFQRPASQSKSPSTKQISEQLQHSHISQNSHAQGPNILLSQIQPNVNEQLVPENDNDETELNLFLETKLQTAIESYNQEKYQQCLIQLNSILLQTNFQLKAKLRFLQKRKFIILSIQIHYYQSLCFKGLNKFNEAIERIEECLKVYVINDQEILGNLSIELSLLYMQTFRFNKALDLFNKLLIFYEQLNWKAEQAYILANIGFIYGIFQNQDEAKRIGTEAIDICRSVLPQDHLKVRECCFFLAYTYFFNKEFDYAEGFLEKALPRDGLDNSAFHIKVLNLLAMVQHLKGLDIQAVKTYNMAIRLSGDKQRGKLLNNLGLVFMENGDLKKAKNALQKAHALIEMQNPNVVSRAKKNIQFMLSNVQYN